MDATGFGSSLGELVDSGELKNLGVSGLSLSGKPLRNRQRSEGGLSGSDVGSIVNVAGGSRETGESRS